MEGGADVEGAAFHVRRGRRGAACDGRLWYHHASRHLNPGATGPAEPIARSPRSSRLGSLIPHLARRPNAAGHEARPPGRAQARRQSAAPIAGQDARRQGGRGRGRRGRRGDAGRRRGGHLGARQGSQGRRHPPQRCRSAQEPPDAQGQRRARGPGGRHRRQGRADDGQGRRRQGSQGSHRSFEGVEGQGRADRGRQGTRRADQVDPRRGGLEGRGHATTTAASPAKASPTKAAAKSAPKKATAAKAPATKAHCLGREEGAGREEGTDGEGRSGQQARRRRRHLPRSSRVRPAGLPSGRQVSRSTPAAAAHSAQQ